MIVAGDLNFGGPGTLPQGRIDTSYVFVDTFSRASGRHSMKARRRVPALRQRELRRGHRRVQLPERGRIPGRNGECVQHHARRAEKRDRPARHGPVRPGPASLSATASRSSSGLRYEWHVTPTERDDRFVVFDAASASLVRVGVDVDEIYQQNNRNFEPRVGVAWNLSPDGRTVLRAAYGTAADEPGTTAVRDTAGNPPFARAAHGGRLDSPRERDRDDAARRARPGDGRSPVPERVDAVVERERATATRPRPGRDARILRLPRHEPSDLAQSSISRLTAFGHSPPWRPPARYFPAHRSATSPRWRAAGFRATTPPGWPSPNACRAVCSSTPRTPGRSRSTPTRSIPPASPFRTATTFPTSTACRISMPGIDSSSARPTLCRSRATS